MTTAAQNYRPTAPINHTRRVILGSGIACFVTAPALARSAEDDIRIAGLKRRLHDNVCDLKSAVGRLDAVAPADVMSALRQVAVAARAAIDIEGELRSVDPTPAAAQLAFQSAVQEDCQ